VNASILLLHSINLALPDSTSLRHVERFQAPMAVNRGPVKERGWPNFFSRFQWAVAIRMWAAQGDDGGADCGWNW